jgi:hypothetical protein
MGEVQQRTDTLRTLFNGLHSCSANCHDPCEQVRTLVQLATVTAGICDNINNMTLRTRSVHYNEVDTIYEEVMLAAWHGRHLPNLDRIVWRLTWEKFAERLSRR